MIKTREPQYATCFDEPPVALGPMTGASFRWNPRRLGMMLARYKFVAKMLSGVHEVAEIGCSDAFAAPVVRQEVNLLHLYDFDPVFVNRNVRQHDIVERPLPVRYDAIYMLDVLEHIRPEDEPRALSNILNSLKSNGVFIAGVPSLESQAYASDISKAGHVNCRTGDVLRDAMRHYFANVFLFGMNDEVVHTGFAPMCQYLFALCTSPRGQ